MKRTSITIIIIIVLGLLSALGVYIYTTSQPTKTYNETSTKEPETDGGQITPIDNIAGLSDLLLPLQMRAFKRSMSTFFQDYLDPNIAAARVVGSPTVNNDGSVTVILTATAPKGRDHSFMRRDPNSNYASGNTVTGLSKANYPLTITIYRNSYSTLTIKIKEYNYSAVEPLSN